jgi:hypothetical protein
MHSQSGICLKHDFGVVIPNHYPDVIFPLVQSLKRLEPDARVIVIADGHTNSYGFEMIPYEGPFVFSKAVNMGIKALDSADVILLNDDCVLLEEFSLSKLAYLGEIHQDIGILSPLIRGCVGNPLQRSHELKTYWKPFKVIQHQGGEMPICFPCVWISRRLINTIGLLDESFTGYGFDDNNYCNRTRAAGFHTSVTSWVTVQHGDGGRELGEGRGKTWSISYARRDRERRKQLETICGKEGWLFQTAEDVFERLKTPATDQDGDNWRIASGYRTSACLQFSGAQYLTLIGPEKASAYARMLPDEIQLANPTVGETIAERIGERCLYPGKLLAWQASDFPTYGPHESHWNDYGAYCVYKAIMARLSSLSGRSLAIIENPEFAIKPGQGYCDLGPSTDRVTYIPQNSQGRCIFDNLIWSRGNVKILTNRDASLPKLVLFRDSFSNTLLPFLAESFSRIVAISSWHPMFDLVASEKPDFVICQVAERYIIPFSYVMLQDFAELCKMSVATVAAIPGGAPAICSANDGLRHHI